MKEATVLHLTPSVVTRSIVLLETNALRAMDSLHVACALEWGADLFVSSDRRQFVAAEGTGLWARFIGQHDAAQDGESAGATPPPVI